jgi:hypothetical protein
MSASAGEEDEGSRDGRRQGVKMIGWYLPAADHRELKRLALDNGTTLSAMYAEFSAMMLMAAGRPVSKELAQTGRKRRGRPGKQAS